MNDMLPSFLELYLKFSFLCNVFSIIITLWVILQWDISFNFLKDMDEAIWH